MARPTDAGSFAEAVYAQLAPLTNAEAELDWPLLKFVGAVGQALQDEDYLAHAAGGDLWSALTDLDRVPDNALPWIGQFVGVAVNTRMTYAQQRQAIRSHVAWGRGTVSYLKLAIQFYLSLSKTVVILERDTSPYHFAVFTYSDETPPDITYDDLYDDFFTYQAFYEEFADFETYWEESPRTFINDIVIKMNKPGGLMYEYTVLPGSPGTLVTYAALYVDQGSYDAAWDHFETYEDLYVNP